ncbi:cation-transporting P-type ATPase [Klebsiella pneumoniae]
MSMVLSWEKISAGLMLNASRTQTNDLLKQFDTHLKGLTEEQAYTQQMTVGLNEVTHEKPLTWWQHLWYCYRNPFNKDRRER